MLLTNRSCPGTSTNPKRTPFFFPESETQINRDSSALLFRKTIRMRSGQRLDQRGFSVVNVPGRANNYVLHGNRHE